MKGINLSILLILIILILTSYSKENFLSSKELNSNISFKEIKEFENLLLNASSQTALGAPTNQLAFKITPMDKLFASFKLIAEGWKQIVEAFKTTRTSEIKERILGKGFDYFKQSAVIQVVSIKVEFLDNYLGNLEKKIMVPDRYQKSISSVIEECRWADSNIWNGFETMFDVNAGGSVKFASILVAKNDEKNTYDFVYNNIQADFKLAPDVLVVSKKLSVLGGIWKDEKDEFVKVPKNLSQDDMKMVMQFFSIVAFKGFLEQFGIDVPFPKI